MKVSGSLTVHLKDAEETRALGQKLGEQISGGIVLALIGDLGAGKTTLTQALARALGVGETVSSPTFLMLNEYHSGRVGLFHFDLYRLQEDVQSPSALHQIKSDMEEALYSNALVVVEWLNLWEEFAEGYEQIRVELKYSTDDDSRVANLSAFGPRAQAVLQKVGERA